MKRLLTTVAAIVASFSLFASTANAVDPVYEGVGWISLYSHYPDLYKIHSIDISEPYVFNWYNAETRTTLKPYVEDIAAQLEAITGGEFVVSNDIDTRTSYTCSNQPDHVITMFMYYRPTGKSGISRAYPCYSTSDFSAWGGMVAMDNEYWTNPNWFSTNPEINEAKTRNAVTHEVGHIMGLDHPNAHNADGTHIPYDCLNGGTGLQPVMCSPNGGAQNYIDGGEFQEWDIAGLQQMVANHGL